MKTIKVPTPRKLPSGNWFIQLSVNGRRISVTEPTEKACIARAMAIKEELLEPVDRSQKPTLSVAIDRYIESRKNVLSPATIKGYRTVQKHRFQAAMSRPVNAYDENGWQRLVNAEAKIVSAKTLQNSWRFISSVICEETGNRYKVRLPQVVSDPREFLDPDQIPVFVEAVHGTKYEIPALMALCSLRRSEILAVKWSDVDLTAGTIQVRGSMVPDENNELVYKKENKNCASRRTVPIMIPQLKKALAAAQGSPNDFVVTMHPSAILNGINRVCEKANLPQVGIHGLRHSYASLSYHLRIPEKIAQKIGGWGDDATMRKIYTHVANKDLTKYQDIMTSYFTNETTNEI
jgi:integrase